MATPPKTWDNFTFRHTVGKFIKAGIMPMADPNGFPGFSLKVKSELHGKKWGTRISHKMVHVSTFLTLSETKLLLDYLDTIIKDIDDWFQTSEPFPEDQMKSQMYPGLWESPDAVHVVPGKLVSVFQKMGKGYTREGWLYVKVETASFLAVASHNFESFIKILFNYLKQNIKTMFLSFQYPLLDLDVTLFQVLLQRHYDEALEQQGIEKAIQVTKKEAKETKTTEQQAATKEDSKAPAEATTESPDETAVESKAPAEAATGTQDETA